VVFALTGPIDASVETSFSMHMVQHLLLTMVAAPLLLLGAPLTLALAAWPQGSRRAFAGVLHSAPARFLSIPLIAWSAFFAVLWAAHLTGFYEAALRNSGMHALEHVAFLRPRCCSGPRSSMRIRRPPCCHPRRSCICSSRCRPWRSSASRS
jgi:cytochrome c oxidase assembly factor CtaG